MGLRFKPMSDDFFLLRGLQLKLCYLLNLSIYWTYLYLIPKENSIIFKLKFSGRNRNPVWIRRGENIRHTLTCNLPRQHRSSGPQFRNFKRYNKPQPNLIQGGLIQILELNLVNITISTKNAIGLTFDYCLGLKTNKKL